MSSAFVEMCKWSSLSGHWRARRGSHLGNPASSEKRNLQEMTHDADGLALSNTVRKNLKQFQEFLETRWAREPKSKTAHSTPFLKFSGAGSCALHEIDAISLWRHREHWWYQGPQFATACCLSYICIFWVAISPNVTLSHLSSRYLCLCFRLACFAAGEVRTKQLLCVTTSLCKSPSV